MWHEDVERITRQAQYVPFLLEPPLATAFTVHFRTLRVANLSI